MSYHRLQTKPLNATLSTLLKRAAHVGLGVGAFTPVLALANPTGGQVVAGQATIAAQNANSLLIKQASQSAIINWQQFSIGSGQYVQFLQPSSSSVVLNRVVGGNASSILGSLSANGQVFLVNPNGIFFGKGASLDVQGIVASTLDMANSDFMSGNYVFQKGSGAADANVINQGSIRARNGGYVVLAGDYSENDGLIQAQSGHVVLASGARTTLTLSGNSMVNFAVDGATLAKFAGAQNTGSLIADGGTVIMTADVANALKATVVNNSGLIEAHSISKNSGAIYLSAVGGNITNAGTLDANAGRMGQAGGDIVLKGDGLTDLTNTSKITATGLGADGGNLEVSGRNINVRGSAKLGQGGNLLLDPNSVDIVAGMGSTGVGKGTGTGANANVGVGFIVKTLNSGANVAISAHNVIHHSSGVSANALTATGAGNLSFKVGTHGAVELGGLNITIGGALTASMGYGSFGFIQAKSVTLNANLGSPSGVNLHKASTSAHGAVTRYSIKATGGDVDINGARVFGFVGGGSGLLAISAKGTVNLDAKVGTNSTSFSGGLTLVGAAVNDTAVIRTKGDVNVTAGAGAIDLTGSQVHAHNVTLAAAGGGLTAGPIEAFGSLTVTDTGGNVSLANAAAYGGALTVTDTTGNMNLGILSGAHNVMLNDGTHTLTFTNSGEGITPNARAGGELLITAGTITQTAGIRDLFLSAGTTLRINGQISLPSDQSSTPVPHQLSHNLQLVGGSSIKLDHSVAVPGSVTIRGGHLFYTGAAKTFSISAGYGTLTLGASIGSAAAAHHANYNVDLIDHGYGLFIEKSIYTGNTAGGLGASITAREFGHNNGDPFSGVFAGNSYGGAVTISAGGSVLLKGWNVGVGSTANHAGNYGAVDVAAGQNLKFSGSGTGTAGGHLRIHAHGAHASNGKVNTSIVVQAGGNMILNGNQVDVHGGSAIASIGSAHNAGTASANVSFAAGGNVAINGGASGNGYVHLTAGNDVVAAGRAFGGQTHKATANANLSIVAGGGISVSGTNIQVSGGYGAARASANEGGATMTAAASATVFMKANNGNITLTGGAAAGNTVKIHTGSFVGESGYAKASSGSNNNATAAAHGDVVLKAVGGISLTADRVDLSVGYGLGHQVSTGFKQVAKGSGNKDDAAYAVTSFLDLKAGAAGISLTGNGPSGFVLITGGGGVLDGASAYGDAPDKATVTANARVDLITPGNINVVSNDFVGIDGGYQAAARTFAQGYEGGSAAITADAGVGLTGANVNIGSIGGNHPHVNITGGSRAAYSDKIFAQSSAAVAISGKGRVDITAGGNITITGVSGITIQGGGDVAGFGNVLNHASHNGHATLTGDDGVALTAAGAISFHAANTIFMEAGYGAAISARMDVKNGSHGVGSITALSELNITAGGSLTAIALKRTFLEAGASAARNAIISAAGSSHNGKATLTANGSVNLSGANIIVKGKTTTSSSGAVLRGGNIGALDAKVFANHSGSAAINAFGSANLTTKGTLRFAAVSGGRLFVAGGNSVAAAAEASGNGGKAKLNATGDINLNGGLVKLQASSAGGNVSAGYGAAVIAKAIGKNHGQGSINVNSGLNVNAASNMIISAAKTLLVHGGNITAAGQRRFSNSTHTTFLGHTGPSSSSSLVQQFNPHVIHTTATASSYGGAVVNATAGVNLNANGTVLILQTGHSGSLEISAGAAAAARASAAALTNGNASVKGSAGISINAGNLVVSGRTVRIDGAAAAGASSSRIKSHKVFHKPSGTTTGSSSSNSVTHQVSARGTGAVAAVSGDGSVSIKAKTGSVSLTATAGSIDVSGGYGNAAKANVLASNGGSGSVSAKSGVSISAKTGFTAAALAAGRGVRMRGGGGSGINGASVEAFGAGAKASLNVNSQLTITAPTVGITALQNVAIGGGSNIASNGMFVLAENGGTAAFKGNAGAAITATTSFSAILLGNGSNGSVDVFGGSRGGNGARVSAGPGGNASLTGNADVNITAGNVLLSARNNFGGAMHVLTGRATGFNMQVFGSGGVATATVSGNVTLDAAGSMIVKAPNGDTVLGSMGHRASVSHGSSLDGQTLFGARAGASNGGKASLTASDNLTITGGTVTLKAATFQVKNSHGTASYGGNFMLANGREAAANAMVKGSNGGSAALNANDQVNIAATAGQLLLKGVGSLTIDSSLIPGRVANAAKASAGGGNAKAALAVNAGMHLSGPSVAFTGGNITVTTLGDSGSAVVTAGFKGQATITNNTALSIVTGGAFTASAGRQLLIRALGGGLFDSAHASHAGAVANLTGLGSVNINANSVVLTGGTATTLEAGGGADDTKVGASYGGAAAMTFNYDMNVTAKTGVSMTLTGQGSGGSMGLKGGGGEAISAKVGTGNGGGKATLTANADLNLTVTGLGGTITLDAGKHTSASVAIVTGGSMARASSHGSYIEQAGKGGSAAVNLSGNLNLSAKGAITVNAGASGNLLVGPRRFEGEQAQIGAVSGGKAVTTIQAVASLSGGTVTLSAGNNLTITAASGVAASAGVHAASNGVATLTATTGTKIVSQGAFTATAGRRLEITTNGSSSSARVADSAGVFASYGGAHATLTATDTVQITAATVALVAGNHSTGTLGISAGSRAGESAHVKAMTRNDTATLTADDSVTISATGNVSLFGGHTLFVGGGRDTGSSARVSAGTSSGHLHIPSNLATASLKLTTGVNLKAGGSLTALASSVSLLNGSDMGRGMSVQAFGHGDVAQATVNGGINLTAANIVLTGRNGIEIAVGSIAGLGAGVFASNGGQATVTATNSINLNATGAIALIARNTNVGVSAGYGNFTSNLDHALDVNGGKAMLQVNSGIGLHAGGSLSINAKHGSVRISGANGVFGSVSALSGSAALTLNANVSVTAGKAMTLNAGGGSLEIHGGGRAGLVADLLPSTSFGTHGAPAGTVQGTLNTGVNLTAGGSVSLTAFDNVTIAAGAGETVAVGKIRKIGVMPATFGNSWGGGSANLSANLSATVTAGKSLTVSAGAGGGSGNVQVLGLGRNPDEGSGFYNIVSVRGGSSHAVANLSLNGNAALTASGNIAVSAVQTKSSLATKPSHEGNVLIEAGSIFNLRADHTVGNVTITGSADAGLNAGHDVVFSAVTGSLTVVAVGGIGGGQEMLVDAHGNAGSASVTGHADANITAGHDIVTTSALGGALNVEGGQFLAVVAIGSAAGSQQAFGTANASLTAGDVITLSGKGGLNVLGGAFGDASVTALTANLSHASHLTSNERRNASMQAKATLTGSNGVTLTFNGDGVIAGGDSVSAKSSSGGRAALANFASINANADVSTSITGKNITLNVGGNLLVRGGGSDKVHAVLFGADNSANFTVNANLNMTATQALTIKVGTGAVGDASFLGGNGENAQLIAGSSNSNHVTGTVHGDLNLTAGTNINLDVRGGLNITGGQGLGASGFAVAGSSSGLKGPHGVATANLTAKTTFTAGGSLAVTLHGGNANLAGGGQAGSHAFVQAITSHGTAAKATYTLDNSLNMTAGGALSLTGAGSVTIATQLVDSSFSPANVLKTGQNTSTSLVGNSAVNITGKTVNINGGTHVTTNSAGTISIAATTNTGSINLDGIITITATAGHAIFAPLAHTLGINAGALKVGPLGSGLGFGAPRSMMELPVSDPTPATSAGHVDLSSGVLLLQSDDSTLTLGSLQSLSPVLSLVTIVAPATGGAAPLTQPAQVTLFDPAMGSAAATSSGACTALVLRQAGGYRCGAGGR